MVKINKKPKTKKQRREGSSAPSSSSVAPTDQAGNEPSNIVNGSLIPKGYTPRTTPWASQLDPMGLPAHLYKGLLVRDHGKPLKEGYSQLDSIGRRRFMTFPGRWMWKREIEEVQKDPHRWCMEKKSKGEWCSTKDYGDEELNRKDKANFWVKYYDEDMSVDVRGVRPEDREPYAILARIMNEWRYAEEERKMYEEFQAETWVEFAQYIYARIHYSFVDLQARDVNRILIRYHSKLTWFVPEYTEVERDIILGWWNDPEVNPDAGLGLTALSV
ncbi:hypothetical protein IAT38_003560 [Cryptococcus sp. DSM 104549]